ncbi:prepilin-type N-terminal cleavage/methylation domain-containing protein [Bermanella sp. R86510]|uniref:prepilin-type N-terminal cleavage/methylation domain-containing protein n=1 Tax=unclassified Bermanella TaxID=2627862 RepID=UPI0037C651BB
MGNKQGFSLIELIIVIIIISILAALGMGLFSAPSQYSATVVASQWLSALRSAQSQALQKQSPLQSFRWELDQVGTQWSVTSYWGSEIIDTFDVTFSNLNVTFSQTNFTSDCRALPAVSTPLVLPFNGMGQIITPSGNQEVRNTRLCVIGDSAQQICIAPSGYAYAGSCIP